MAQSESARASKRRYYQANRERVIEAAKRWQEEHPEEYRARLAKWRQENLERERERARQWKAENREKHREGSRRYAREHATEISEKRRAQRRTLKQTVIDAYGGACACCGETVLEFLTIDHVNGDGADHRRLLGTRQSARMYEHLVAEGFPSGFRALCFNCNTALGFYGYCPHHPEIKVPINRGVKGGGRAVPPSE